MKLLLPLLLLALPAPAQLRSAPAYDGSSPGHPADEPGPELGATAEDAFALLKRGDRDAARLSAARCLRGDAGDERCRLVVEAVEEGIEAPKLPAKRADLYRADVHFRAGADWYFHGQPAEARREWDACRRLDPGNPFCALGLGLLRRGATGASRREETRALSAAPEQALLKAKQAYLKGLVHFQKGDYGKARDEWLLCMQLAARGSDDFSDCLAGLERIEKLHGAP